MAYPERYTLETGHDAEGDGSARSSTECSLSGVYKREGSSRRREQLLHGYKIALQAALLPCLPAASATARVCKRKAPPICGDWLRAACMATRQMGRWTAVGAPPRFMSSPLSDSSPGTFPAAPNQHRGCSFAFDLPQVVDDSPSAMLGLPPRGGPTP